MKRYNYYQIREIICLRKIDINFYLKSNYKFAWKNSHKIFTLEKKPIKFEISWLIFYLFYLF